MVALVRSGRRGAMPRAQLGEGLRGGDFMDQVQVDVQHRGGGIGFGHHHVGVPEFVEEGAGGGAHAVDFIRIVRVRLKNVENRKRHPGEGRDPAVSI